MKKLTDISIARNIPFVDNTGLGFHFQKSGKRVWIEVPFIALSFRIK